MRLSSGHNQILLVNKVFPNLLVKTYHGNVFLNNLIRDKWMIVYSNPSDLMPRNLEEKKQLVQHLKELKSINCELMGFSTRGFKEHLVITNWVNSYLNDELVFPIFYHTEGILERDLGEESMEMQHPIIDPVYLVDKDGMTRVVLNGLDDDNRKIEKVLDWASRAIGTHSMSNPVTA
ncbi:redoxin domain-containing protein [Pleomorphovibrio marinus]|uniref:redoxin domain-containing protein n=1 Tax=Pleomorphovibrio marinus TaxID=2164132 RepID=UPI000E0B2580|nr:redoxin domain-containing protein [Pleomorphovibrio marinus]